MNSRSAAAFLFLLLLALPVAALVDPVPQGALVFPDFDSRSAEPTARQGSADAIKAWGETLGHELRYAINPRSGSLKTVFADHGDLGRISNEALTDPVAAGREFLASHEAIFGLTSEDRAGLIDRGSYTDRRGLTIIKLLPTHKGVPLATTPIKIYVREELVRRVNAGAYSPGLKLDVLPELSAAEAILLAAQDIASPYDKHAPPVPLKATGSSKGSPRIAPSAVAVQAGLLPARG